MTSIATLKSALAGVGGDISVTWPGNLIMVPALDLYTALGGVMPPKLLPVPYYSQESVDARRYANECGVVCVRMLFDWLADSLKLPRLPLTTDQLAAETSLAQSDTGLGNAALVTLAGKHNLSLKVSGGVNQGFVQGQIDAGLPLICLISYAPILSRENQRDTSGHFVVAVGYDAQNIYVNDPDWWNQGNYTADMGHNLRIPWPQFNVALLAYGNTGCIVARLFVPTKLYVALTAMNIRSGPSVYYGVVGNGAKLGTTVIVDLLQQIPDTAGNVFVPLWGGNWIALKNTPQNIIYLDVVMPAPPTTKPVAYSRHSVHYLAGGNWDYWAAILRQRAASGKPVPGMLICSMNWSGEPTPEMAIQAGALECIWRDYPGESRWAGWQDVQASYQAGYDFVLHCRLPAGSLDKTFIQIINEPTAVGPGTASYWNGAMDAAKVRSASEKRPVRLAVGCFSWGFPDYSFWPSFFDVLRRVRDENHRFMLHQYRPDPDNDAGASQAEFVASVLSPDAGLRHQKIYALFPADLKTLPLALGEFLSKVATKIPPDWYKAAIQAYSAAISNDQIIYLCHWTDGTGGGAWKDSDLYNDKLDAIGAA